MLIWMKNKWHESGSVSGTKAENSGSDTGYPFTKLNVNLATLGVLDT